MRRSLLGVLLILLVACPARRDFPREVDDDDSAGDDDDLTFPQDDDDSADDDDDDDDDDTVVDADGDGFSADLDCDDADPDVNPGATEVCNNQTDDDCSGDAPECRWSGVVGLDSAFARLDGVAGDRLGTIGYAADVTGDGSVDLVLAAYQADSGANGSVFVVPTPLPPGPAAVASVASSRIDGSLQGEQLGGGLFIADLDDDGALDLALGAPGADFAGVDSGALYIFFGAPPAGPTTTSSADLVIDGDTVDGLLGGGSTGACDLDGDGAHDLVQRAPRASPLGRSEAGAVYVWYGPIGATDSIASADAQIFGAAPGDELGAELSCHGDLDGDGDDDLAIGAQLADDGASGGGVVYLLYDAPAGLIDLAVATPSAKITATGADDRLGWTTWIVPDTDGDGADDLMIGARTSDLGGQDTGAAWLFTGTPTGDLTTDDAQAAFSGVGIDDRAGQWASSLGDLDGDGYTDFAIGARRSDLGGTDSGATYVVYGPVAGALSLDDADAVLIGDGPGISSSSFVQVTPDITGDAAPDLLIGGYLADFGGGDAGAVYIVAGLGY